MKLVVCMVLVAFGILCRGALAQQISSPDGPLALGADVVFTISGNTPIGAESELAAASILPSSKTITVGKARAGVFPLRFFSGQKVVLEGYLVLVPHDSGKLNVRWESDLSTTQTSQLREPFSAYIKHLTAARMKRLTGPAMKKFAGENPVQVASVFVVCVTPGMTSLCVVSFSKAGKDCAVEMLKLAADDMVKDSSLTKEQAEQVKSAIVGVNVLVDVTLAGTDFVKDLKDPNLKKKVAAGCEAMAGVTGASSELIGDTNLKVAVKAFSDLIERTCLLIKEKGL